MEITCPLSHSSCHSLMQAQPHPVSHCKLSRPVLLIILPLHEFLRVQQTVTDVSQKSVPVKQLPIQSLNPCRPWLVWNQCRRITAIHNMKGVVRKADWKLVL
jgi:hypothetical protein